MPPFDLISEQGLDRRRFIKVCGGAGVAGVAASGCKPTMHYPQYPLSAERVMSIPLSAFSAEKPYVLARHPEFRFPVCVYQLGAIDYSASLLMCRHKPCEVAVQPSAFVCPCHGSRYSHRGELEKGPADMSLKTYAVQVRADSVAVTLLDVSAETMAAVLDANQLQPAGEKG